MDNNLTQSQPIRSSWLSDDSVRTTYMNRKGSSAAKAANGSALPERRYSFEDERRTITALRPMRDAALRRGEEPNGPNLIFDAIRFLVDVDRKQPGDKPSQPGNTWVPHTHDAEEIKEAFKQRMIDLTAGDDADKVLSINRHAISTEVSRAESIERVFRAHLDGQNQNRDWKILWRLAEKLPHKVGVQCRQPGSLRAVGAEFGLDELMIRKIKDKRLLAIWQAPILEPLRAPLPVATGVVWYAKEAA